MSVGSSIGSSQIDNVITNLAVNLRNIMREIYNLNQLVNGQGTGLAYLELIGYSNDPNQNNPGGVSDAALALSLISYLTTVSGVYFGTASQASDFNFDQELSQVWAGQIS